MIKSVAASSCEAEYMSAAQAVRALMWLRYLFSDLGYGDLCPVTYGTVCGEDYRKERLAERGSDLEVPVMLCGDNKGCIAISRNPVLHKRSKHIHIKYHIVRQHVNKRHVQMTYINTADNVADLMTKALPKVTHEKFCNLLMTRFAEGVLRPFAGDTAKPHAARPVCRDKLYLVKPKGIIDEDMLVREEGRGPRAVGGSARTCVTKDNVVAMVVMSMLGQRALKLLQALSGTSGFWGSAASTALVNAIVDSGASFTFVTKGVQLEDSAPGVGRVWVANGQSEGIAESGKLGPLSAKKVNSFERTLVSVRDLVDLYGGVLFNSSGVHVVSESAARQTISTQIGEATTARLYSFDLPALERHDLKLNSY